MKGFKGFNKDLQCRGFQFEVGKTYEVEGQTAVCSTGFHFCENAFDIYNYYGRTEETRVCEIEALGEYVIPIGKKYKGKKLSELSSASLKSFVQWVDDNIEHKSDQTQEFIMIANEYLKGTK
jgi:hypothetical protein